MCINSSLFSILRAYKFGYIYTIHKLGHYQRRFTPDSIDVGVVNFVAVGCGILSVRNWVPEVLKHTLTLPELACVTHYRYAVLEYSVHITVEVSSTITAVEYLYKFVYKCYDCLHVVLTGHICFGQFGWDKTEAFIDSRFVSVLWQCGSSLNMKCTISPP